MQGIHWSLMVIILSSCSGQQDETVKTQVPPPSAAPIPVVETAPKVKKPVAHFVTHNDSNFEVTLEIADTPAKTTRGLMYRRHLPPDHGMLFVFDQEKIQSFWMKNTLISLDMIFINSEFEVVGVVHEAEPQTTTPRSVPMMSRFVVEVNGGVAKAQGIEAGSTCRFENVPGF